MARWFAASVRVLIVVGLLGCNALALAQQGYPAKPIRFIVPFSAGGGSDVMARLIGPRLTEIVAQPVVVDNRPGGDTIIGTEVVARSTPDGYTILLAASTLVTIPLLHSKVPFDVIKDFAAVATLASGEQLLVLHPSVPVSNLQEFIALAKSRPGQLNYSSGGIGITNHLAGEMFNIMAGVKIHHIPYKGGGPALIDLIGGQVQMFINNPLTLIPHIRSGRIKAMAISGETRSPALPQVPTFTEAGLPNVDMRLWYGVLAPAGTPKRNIDKLSADIGAILAAPEVREKLVAQGMEPFISNPGQLAVLMKTQMAKYEKIIKTANIKLEH